MVFRRSMLVASLGCLPAMRSPAVQAADGSAELDRVTYPNYHAASSISGLSRKGCAIGHPGHVYSNRTWRHAYAECLAEAIGTAQW